MAFLLSTGFTIDREELPKSSFHDAQHRAMNSAVNRRSDKNRKMRLTMRIAQTCMRADRGKCDGHLDDYKSSPSHQGYLHAHLHLV